MQFCVVKKDPTSNSTVYYAVFCVFFNCYQLGTLGAGNHYAEIQIVDEIFNTYAAKKMGVDHVGQVSHN